MSAEPQNILVIKLSALGDFVLATAAFADIRAHHPNARITLMTTSGFAKWGGLAPWFDAVTIDARDKLWKPGYLRQLRRQLSGFDRVYDLQTNDRTSLYFWLAGRPEWSGIARGCSHPHTNPNRNAMHTLDRVADQLAAAGVAATHKPDLTFALEPADEVLAEHSLKAGEFVALVPGCAPTRPRKRWPHFAELARELTNAGHTVALIGGPAEAELTNEIAVDSGAVNLCAKTSMGQLVDVFGKARAVIGNDTGPMHIAAASGLKSGVVLFGPDSDPALCAPRASNLTILNSDPLSAISPQQVRQAVGLN